MMDADMPGPEIESANSNQRASADLDIAANRNARKWSSGELAGRVLWALARPVFRYSPRIFWGFRRGCLRLFGAHIGPGVHIHPSVSIAIPWNLRIEAMASVGDNVRLYSLGLISIGASATVSQAAHLCAGTHDYRRADFPLLKAPINVGEGAWVCADAFVGPGVTVGDYAIVGARAVIVSDVPAWTIVSGNPARPTGPRPPIVAS